MTKAYYSIERNGKTGRPENRDNSIWLVEWIPHRESYRISRYSKPNLTVAYDDYWEDAIWKGIDVTYPEWDIILLKFENGMTSWAINPAKFECEYVEVNDGSND